jgi:hypothetical protein
MQKVIKLNRSIIRLQYVQQRKKLTNAQIAYLSRFE